MKRKFAYACAAAILALCLACGNNDQQRAREKAEEAKQKARAEAERAKREMQKLGQQAKREANKLDESVNDAMRRGQPDAQGTAGAKRKLQNAGQELRTASEHAAVKLDRAAVIAKVKAKLATDVGLSAAASVDVDSSGQVVTLRGTVSSEEQKQEAERAVTQLNGVTKVINLLQVKP